MKNMIKTDKDFSLTEFRNRIDFEKLDSYSKSVVDNLLQQLESTTNQLSIVQSNLNKSKINLNSILSDSHTMLLLDKNLCIREFTQDITDYYNITSADISRPIKNYRTTFEDHYRLQIIDSANKIIAGEEKIRLEIGINEKCILIEIKTYRSNASTLDGVLIYFINISMSKKLEKELESEKEKLIFGYNIAKFATCEWNIQNDIILPNENWFTLLGQQPTDSNYRIASLLDIIHPMDKTLVTQLLEDYLSGKKGTFYAKFRIVTSPNHSPRWLEINVKETSFDENYFPINGIIIIHEITALIEQETELHIKDMVLRNSMIQTISFNKHGDITYANNLAMQTVNFFDDTSHAIKYSSVISYDRLLEMDWDDYYKQLKKEKYHQFEGFQIDSNNNKVPVIVSENYIKYGDKESVFVFILNITESLESKENFKETLELYKMAEDIAEIGYIDISIAEGTTKLSDGLYRFIDTDKVNHFTDFFQYTSPGEVKSIRDTFNSALTTREPFDIKLKLNINNNPLHIRAKGRFICDKKNNPIRAIILIMNITETVLNEMRILENKIKFKSLFENMSSPCSINRLIYNNLGEPTDFMVLDCNNNFLDTFSLTFAEAINSKASNSPVFSSTIWLDTCKNVVKTSNQSQLEVNFNEIGKYYIVHIYKHSKDTFVTIFSDISTRKILEKEAIHNEKMAAIGQLAGGVAHDFNNQLMGMQGSIELIKHSGNPDIIEKYTAMIENSIKSCTGLINQLLTFSKKRDYIGNEIDAHDTISKTIDILSHTFDKKITIKSNLESEYSIVTGDSSLLESAIMNIMINARDAMPSGGKICIKTLLTQKIFYSSEPKWYIQVDISDTGHGIDPETQKRIFDPFFTTKGHDGGNGMGLSTVYGTIEKMDGFIDVESKVDYGTTFSIYLPISIKSNFQQAENSMENLKLMLPYSILLVDDEPIVRDVLSTLLRQEGLNVADFESSVDAIKFYEKNYKNIDLVFLDMIMPEINGLELYERLNKINPEIKAFLISGFSDGLDIEQAVECGLLGKLHKPIEIEHIVKEIIKLQNMD